MEALRIEWSRACSAYGSIISYQVNPILSNNIWSDGDETLTLSQVIENNGNSIKAIYYRPQRGMMGEIFVVLYEGIGRNVMIN